METFEFVVTSIARVALKEHVKAEGVEDAITGIEDNDYYEDREYELIDYESTEDTAEYKLNSKESLWTSEY